MTMTKFEDQLFTDLMQHYGQVLQRTRRPAPASPRTLRRPGWLAAGAAGAAAVAAGLGLAVAALVPGSGSSPGTAQLTAWTVTKLADGNVSVTIRQLKDPAGLQARLRADGVPASVTFASQQIPACRPYPGGTPGAPPRGTPLLDRVFPTPYHGRRGLPNHAGRARSIVADGRSNRLGLAPDTAVIVIHPSALPGNAGVQIATVYGGTRGVQAVDMPTVVYASPQCTGT